MNPGNGLSLGGHRLKKVQYEELNSKQKENYNFQKVSGLMADYGFNCMRLSDDWLGADFLAHHFKRKVTLKIQLKSRVTIAKKYQDKDVWVAFPNDQRWYLIHHEDLIKIIDKNTQWLKTNSWKKKHGYSTPRPGPALLKALEPYAL